MMTWDPEKKILTMDLHNLQHCGFELDDFEGELFLNGIDDPAARAPGSIVVDCEGLGDLMESRGQGE